MTIEPVVWPKFADGALLTAADFSLEQGYLTRRLRQLGKLIGWRVVEGMEVAIDGGELVVAPGLALDANGCEIALDHECRRKLGAGWLCARRDEPEELPAATIGKTTASWNPKSYMALMRECAKIELHAPKPDAREIDPLETLLRNLILDGWAPLARVEETGGAFQVFASRGVTTITSVSWGKEDALWPEHWKIGFSAPIKALNSDAIEIRLRPLHGAETILDATIFRSDPLQNLVEFAVGWGGPGLVTVRLACDYVVDWKWQAVSSAPPDSIRDNPTPGGVFVSWFRTGGSR